MYGRRYRRRSFRRRFPMRRKTFRRNTFRRSFKRRRLNRALRRNSIQRIPTALPYQRSSKFKFSATLDMTTVDQNVITFNTNFFKFRGNGAADPTDGASSLQPYYWDQVSPQYLRYICYGSKIRLTISPRDEISDEPLDFVLIPAIFSASIDTFTSVDVRAIREHPGRIIRSLQFPTAGGRSVVITKYHSTRYMMSAPPQAVSEPNGVYSAATPTAVPASQWKWNLFALNATDNLTGLTQSVIVRVEITYYVKFVQRILFGSST